MSAKRALDQLAREFGGGRFSKLVEMKGSRGQSQPAEWYVVAFDSRSDYLLRTFWAGEGREVTNEGVNDAFYPTTAPAGFLSTNKVKIDSTEAFALLDAEAAKAMVGFNSINYVLRCREFSDEPIWSLTAVDRNDHVVGIVHISALHKKVLRSIWFHHDRRTRSGMPMIADSALGALRPAAPPRRPAPPPPARPRPPAALPVPQQPFAPAPPRVPSPPPPLSEFDTPVVEEVVEETDEAIIEFQTEKDP